MMFSKGFCYRLMLPVLNLQTKGIQGPSSCWKLAPLWVRSCLHGTHKIPESSRMNTNELWNVALDLELTLFALSGPGG